MRVVAGELGGRTLITPPGTGTRPTTDKVRLAIFNSLDSAGLVRDATVADLFAGSGAMGIEALSRGAASCTFVEREQAALRAIRDNIATLGLAARSTVVAGDALDHARRAGRIDLALADPPYEWDRWDELQARLDAGTLVAESSSEVVPIAGWETVRARRYGRTFVTVLRQVA